MENANHTLRGRAAFVLVVLCAGGLSATACGNGGAKDPEPTGLHFIAQPVTAQIDVPLAQAIQVAIQDAEGNTVPTALDAVELSLEAGPPGAMLGGTTTVTAQAGIASFSDLTIDTTGQGFTLRASSGSLAPATSQAFDVWISLQEIVEVDFDQTTLVIDGAEVYYTASLVNHAPEAVLDVILQGSIEQPGARLPAGGRRVLCGEESGVLPPGECSVTAPLVASNQVPGTGTLVPGAATAILELKTDFDTVLDSHQAPIWLTGSADQRITSLVLDATTLVIEGPVVAYALTLVNEAASPVSTVLVQAYLEQGEALRAAGGSMTRCGEPGVLPIGECSFTMELTTTNLGSGDGTLVPGPATAVFELTEQNVQVLESYRVPVTLTD